ncbi:MAG: O-acetylhomoserine sulfhydrylase / O-succinylhomoserine sulfhydrylase [uncultured Thermomicrobiales bacterium]|uniref:O-acetylhomoserine sulfhydrylase / O-succinylhomoserine sulfhydrylase n=1 Tax=uncultured Thermomicrobiales bacterium TaxID=1645740 RepID=A0A6J4UVK1_9BACT|nr:MAG: O-acetylhomoserine sulfhydrylase / O-succinylhomoserine sulfhydrylase [uncultured Thermomicrobiales bacterium]
MTNDNGTSPGPRPDRLANAGFATRSVHGGERQGTPDYTPTVAPIHLSASFFYDDTNDLDAVFANEREGYVYTRYGNPTLRALEQAIAALEDTEDAVTYASGMAAIHAAILLDARSGDRIVAGRDVYGATYAILSRLFASLDIETTFVDTRDLDAVEATVARVRPTLVICETISNPLVRVADIPALARIAHAHGAKLMVDNTFASPLLVNPARLGADTVVHSATKYLGGHGDATAGVIATTAERALALREQAKLVGPTLGAFEAWLIQRGIKTLPLRVRAHSDGAVAVAAWLRAHPSVSEVFYPEDATIGDAAAIFNDHRRGGMLAFEIRDADRSGAFRFMEALKLIIPATTLGDVYTLVLHPAMSSHRALTPEQREEIGIREGLIRLSVGIEDVDDITGDLDQALRVAVGAPATATTA